MNAKDEDDAWLESKCLDTFCGETAEFVGSGAVVVIHVMSIAVYITQSISVLMIHEV